ASSVIDFSSQYSSGGWSAQQATGQPNTLSYGDISTAWSARPMNGTQEHITLGFATPVQASGIIIRETNGNGYVTRVELLDTDTVYHEVWVGTDPSLPGTPVNFTINFPQTPYLVQGARISVDTNHDLSTWEEMDAVKLLSDPAPDRYNLVVTRGAAFA